VPPVTGALLLAIAVGALAASAAAAPGNLAWVSRYSDPAGLDDYSKAVTQSADGASVDIAGAAGHDFATLALAGGTGVAAWTSTYDGPAEGYDGARAIGRSPDGDVLFVTGRSQGPVTKRTSPSGLRPIARAPS